MRKRTILIALLIHSFIYLQAQAPQFAVVRPDGTTFICPTLDSAYNKAQNADYIYLPAGGFSLSYPIKKELHFYGAGHNPDSTLATGRTVINSTILIDSGANNGSITGCYFTGSSFYVNGQIHFNAPVNGYTISRCYITGGVSSNSAIQNVLLRENFIGSYSVCFTCGNAYSINISAASATIQVANNLLQSKVALYNGLLANNIFLHIPNFDQTLITNSATVQNNIFRQPGHAGNNNSYFNNINYGVNGVDPNGNQGSNNIFLPNPIDALFVNFQGYSYLSDFHLIPGSPYSNAGTDGTPIGLYGGSIAWKEGSVPSNPHIYFKQVAPNTNNNGQLPVQFKVRTNN